jgi:trehalose 6-phosphate phosphatase
VLSDPANCALFLDLDGTLLNLATTPKGVEVPAGLIDLLDGLYVALGGAVAIVTGRHIADVDRLLQPLRLPASGVHGSELRVSAESDVAVLTGAIPSTMFAQISEMTRSIPGAFTESKETALTVHYRLAPEAEQQIAQQLSELLARHAGQFRLVPGRKVFEILPAGLSKGTALRMLAAMPQFSGRTPIMIGDDVGDEPAFEASQALSGHGLRVAGEHFSIDFAAFQGPSEVRIWLAELLEVVRCKEVDV